MEDESLQSCSSDFTDNSSEDQETDQSAKTNNRRQIFIAFVACYICISGGNLVGFTSSAIPSIREGKSAPFFRVLENSFQNLNSSTPKKKDVAEGVAFRIQEIDQALEGNGLELEFGKDETIMEFMKLTDAQASWIGSLAPLGAFMGSLLAPFPIRYLGPKGTLLKIGVTLYIVSWLATSFAPSLMWIYISRMAGGIAMGVNFSAVPIYIVDTSPINLRGPLGTLSQFLFTIGVLISFILGYFFDWRTSALISALISCPALIMLPIIPESPKWLLSKEKCQIQDAENQKLHPCYKQDPLDIMNQNCEICGDSSSQKSYLSLSPKAVESTLVAIFLCIFQQLTGINGVNFYTVTIFEIAAGENSFLDGHTSAIIVALVFCLANVVSYFLIEKLGRKFLLLVSTAMISLSSFSLGSYFYILESGRDTTNLTFIPLVSLVTFVLAFSIGYGPLLYPLVAEILTNDIRNIMTPVAVGVNWLSVFLVAKTFPALIHSLNAYGAFWLYGTFSCISFVVTIFYVPETKGKVLE